MCSLTYCLTTSIRLPNSFKSHGGRDTCLLDCEGKVRGIYRLYCVLERYLSEDSFLKNVKVGFSSRTGTMGKGKKKHTVYGQGSRRVSFVGHTCGGCTKVSADSST